MRRLESPDSARSASLIEPERARETVERALAGDPAAFRLLVEAHERAVFGLCRRLLFGNEAEAEDVTQETFLRAYRFLGRLEDLNRFSPWLYQIARSLCRDRRRRSDVERRALAERAEMLRRNFRDRADGAAGGSLEGESEPGPNETCPVLGELPPEEKEALTLRYFEGLSYEEIAGRLKLSFSQVDHLIRKARARLSRRLLVRRRLEPK
jgi:RNA polymerase sigma-70 factor (ECF subfamily)